MATSNAMSTSNQYVKYKISVTQNSQNVTTNTSNVTVSVRFYRTNTGYTTYGSGTVYLKINGTTYSQAVTSDQKITSGGIVLITRSLNISHNADGTKTLNTSAWISLNTPLTSSEQSYSETLSTIPRATAPTVSSSTVAFGSSVTISTPRASSSFTHTLRYGIGNASGTIATSVATSKSWTIPLSLASNIPNATSGVLTVFCDTYNGSTKIGTKSVNITVTVPASVVPTISNVAVTEKTPGLASKFNAFVKTKSVLGVAITANGSYGSSIISYITQACGNTYNGSSFDINTVNLCNTVNLVTTIKDSRGRTATYTKSINVLEYIIPTISRFSVWRCDQDGTANDAGEYIKVSYAFSITALNNLNDKSYTISYKANGSSSYTTLKSGNVYSANTEIVSTNTFSTDTTFKIKLEIADYFKTISREIEIPTAFVLQDFKANGKGIAFGKVSEKNGIEFNLPMYDNYGLSICNGLAIYNSSAIDPNTSLEELILTDHTNAPETGFYYIRTMFYSTKSATANRSQIAIPYNTKGGIWYRYYFDGSWSAWSSSEKDTGWINLTLSSGWSVPYTSDPAQYRKIGNVVYFRGLINATSGAGTTIATIPEGYRPALGNFKRYVCSLNQTENVVVQINANGVLSDHQKGSSSRTFLSLNGIFYPI